MPESIKPNGQSDIKTENKTDTKQNQFNIALVFKSAYTDMIRHKVAPIFGWITVNLLLIVIGIYVVKSPLFTIFVVILLWLFTFAHFISKQFASTKRKIYSYSLPFILTILMFVYYNPFSKEPENICSNPQSLWDCFDCEFNKSFVNTETIVYQKIKRQKKITVTAFFEDGRQMDTNFTIYPRLTQFCNDNTCSISYYVPKIGIPFLLNSYLADSTYSFVDEYKKDVAKSECYQQGMVSELWKATFNKQVYLYVENSLFQHEKDSIINMFKKHDLNLQIRDTIYFLQNCGKNH